MRRKLPPLNALRAFEAVARHLSFTHAAGELNVTQGAVSYQINILEERLGALLFRREGRQIVLTRAGQTLFPVVQRAFSEIAEAASALSPAPDGAHLTVALSTYFAAHWLSKRLGRFSQQHPGIGLRLQHPETSADLASGDVDMVIRWDRADWSQTEFESKLLFLADVTPVCSPQLQTSKHPANKPDDLRNHTLLRDDMSDIAWREWLRMAKINSFGSIRELKTNDPNVYLQAAIDGQGFALVDSLIADEIALGRLIRPFKVCLEDYGYFVVFSRETLNRRSAKLFFDWLVAEANLTARRLAPQ